HPDHALTPRSDNTTSTLQTCLSQSGGYERSYPTSSTYPTLSSYNPIFTYKPLVIAVPSTVDEISSIIKCVAAENGKQKLTPRSGGHSYKAYSLGGHDGSVVVDLRLLDDVTVDEIAKTATVGAGVRLAILNYTYSYKTNVDCAKAIVALQNMTLSTDAATGFEPGFGSELLIAGESAGDFDGNACQLSGQHIDTTQPDHDQLIHRFHTLANITPASSTFTPFTTWIHSLQNIMGNLSITSQINSDHEQFYAKSLVQPPIVTYTYDSALALVDKLNSYAGL
ncbi:hypothetical protein, partial [Sporisorium scitamineum]